jgi:hypothetical protein
MLTENKKYQAAVLKRTIEHTSSSKQIDNIANQFSLLDHQVMPAVQSKKSTLDE